ncbi:hypothetical protein [Cupriavidus sp. L7L]|uniref:hypothetical protein n=1 Tax=Cupriavidus sp. L7L TaxID=2546443 RepID=UPI00105660D7|nr:hypothetical protein [Cupriavidus sp. L7L]TDF62132.1 hypothetical protein E1J61_31010 [Cupriavidus sp. L7L]
MRVLAELSLLRREVAAFARELRCEALTLSRRQGRTQQALIEEALDYYLLDARPRTRLVAFAAAVDICPHLAARRLHDVHQATCDCLLLRTLFWSSAQRLKRFGWL